MSKLKLLLILCAITHQPVWAFNLAAHPTLIFSRPADQVNLNQSTYFGHSINLRQNSIMISAPLADSTLLGKRVKKPGVIYKCVFTDNKCEPYTIDQEGNLQNNEYDSEYKDNQMLGFALDGGSKESNNFIACTPNLGTKIESVSAYLVQGGCYLIDNTEGSEKKKSQVKKIRSYKAEKQGFDKNRQRYCQEGFSVEETSDSEEFIVGSPGCHSGRGGISVYRIKESWSTPIHVYKQESSPNGYLGYGVVSACLERTPASGDHCHSHYIASAPMENYRMGNVNIYKRENSGLILKKTLLGMQIGEYFGYSILANDFDNDGLDDIIVSAPMHGTTGIVYYFSNMKNLNFQHTRTLHGVGAVDGRFGTALGKLGDIDGDYHNDLAVGAPFEGNGVVYIFMGSSTGLKDKWAQKLESPDNDLTKPKWFGYSLSRGLDIDGNSYNDIAIGDSRSESVYIYKSYPVVIIEPTLKTDTKIIPTWASEKTFELCFKHRPNREISVPVSVTATIKIVSNLATVDNPNLTFANIKDGVCKKVSLDIRAKNVFKELAIRVNYDISPKPKGKEFCKECAAVDPQLRRFIEEKFIFNTGCPGSKCEADLKLSGALVTPVESIIEGSDVKEIQMQYSISNDGDAAYTTELVVQISKTASYQRFDGDCVILESAPTTLICSISNVNQTLVRGSSQTIGVTIDVLEFALDELVINATVKTESLDKSSGKNIIIHKIPVYYESLLDVLGQAKQDFISLDAPKQIEHYIVIQNDGPSSARNLTILIDTPEMFTLANGTEVKIFEKTKVTAIYNRELPTDIQLGVHNSNKISSKEVQGAIKEAHSIFYDCQTNKCQRFSLHVDAFGATNTLIVINVTYSVNVTHFDYIFNATHPSFVFESIVNASWANPFNRTTLTMRIVNPYTVIKQAAPAKTPLWIYIVSGVAGIVIVLIIAIVLYHLGFFKRDTAYLLHNDADVSMSAL